MKDVGGRSEIEIITLGEQSVPSLSEKYLPDESEEAAFVPLERLSPELSRVLGTFFAEEFVRRTGEMRIDIDEVIRTTDLRVASFPYEHGKRLRLTSRLTGGTFWYVEWDGTEESARDWIAHEVAAGQAASALHDEALRRRTSRGPKQP